MKSVTSNIASWFQIDNGLCPQTNKSQVSCRGDYDYCQVPGTRQLSLLK